MKYFSGISLVLFVLITIFCSEIRASDSSGNEMSDTERMIQDEMEKFNIPTEQVTGSEIRIDKTETRIKAKVDSNDKIIIEDYNVNASSYDAEADKGTGVSIPNTTMPKKQTRDIETTREATQTIDKEETKRSPQEIKENAEQVTRWGFISLFIIFLGALFGIWYHMYLTKRRTFRSNSVLRLLFPLLPVTIICILTRFFINYFYINKLNTDGASIQRYVHIVSRWFVPLVKPDLSYYLCSFAGLIFYFALGSLFWIIWRYTVGGNYKYV